MTVEFPVRQWKWHLPFDLVRIIDWTGNAERLSGGDWRRSEWTDSNIQSINDLNCTKKVNQVIHFYDLHISINSVIFAFCKLCFCHDSLENIAGIDAC